MPHVELRSRLLACVVTWISAGTALAAAPCPNHFFPLRPGRTLTYQAGKARFTLQFSHVEDGPDGQTATLEVEQNGRRRTTQVKCTANGIVAEAGGLEGLALRSSGMEMKVLSSEGVLLPTEDALRARRPWSNKVSIEMRPPENQKLPGGLRPVLRTQFAKTGVVTGEEAVTTPAGTFQALKVKNLTTASSGAVGSERKVESTMWLAPDVGIVKVVTGDATDLELLEVSEPPPAKARKPGHSVVPASKRRSR